MADLTLWWFRFFWAWVGWAWVSSGSNMHPRSCFSNLNMHENHPDSDLVKLSRAWRCISNKLSGAVRPERFRFNSSGVWPSHQNFEQTPSNDYNEHPKVGSCPMELACSVSPHQYLFSGVLCFQFKTRSLLNQENFSGYPVLLRLPLLILTNTAPILRLALLPHLDHCMVPKSSAIYLLGDLGKSCLSPWAWFFNGNKS